MLTTLESSGFIRRVQKLLILENYTKAMAAEPQYLGVGCRFRVSNEVPGREQGLVC